MLTKAEALKGRGLILLETVHGSRLYGLSKEGSDKDYYIVTEFGASKQRKTIMEDGEVCDLIVIGLKAFLREVDKGTHQALEALMSKKAKVDFRYKPMLDSIQVNSIDMRARYTRTIKKLCFDKDLKRRILAVRLAHNLNEALKTGRFNPTLSPTKVKAVLDIANKTEAGKPLLEALSFLVNISENESEY